MLDVVVGPFLHPGVVVPGVTAQVSDYGSGAWADFAGTCQGVGFFEPLATL